MRRSCRGEERRGRKKLTTETQRTQSRREDSEQKKRSEIPALPDLPWLAQHLVVAWRVATSAFSCRSAARTSAQLRRNRKKYLSRRHKDTESAERISILNLFQGASVLFWCSVPPCLRERIFFCLRQRCLQRHRRSPGTSRHTTSCASHGKYGRAILLILSITANVTVHGL